MTQPDFVPFLKMIPATGHPAKCLTPLDRLRVQDRKGNWIPVEPIIKALSEGCSYAEVSGRETNGLSSEVVSACVGLVTWKLKHSWSDLGELLDELDPETQKRWESPFPEAVNEYVTQFRKRSAGKFSVNEAARYLVRQTASITDSMFLLLTPDARKEAIRTELLNRFIDLAAMCQSIVEDIFIPLPQDKADG